MDIEKPQLLHDNENLLDAPATSGSQPQISQRDILQNTSEHLTHWPSDEYPQLSSQAEDMVSLLKSDFKDSAISEKLEKFAKDVAVLEEQLSKNQAIIQRQQVQIQHLSEASSPHIIAQLREELSMCKQENEALQSIITTNAQRQQAQPANQVSDVDPNWVMVNTGLEKTTESKSMMLYPDSPLMKRIDELQNINAKLFKANKDWHSKWEQLRQSKQEEKEELVSRLKKSEEDNERLKAEITSLQNKIIEDKEKIYKLSKEKDAQIALQRQQLTVFMQDFEKEKKEKQGYQEKLSTKEKEYEKLKAELEQKVKALKASAKLKDDKMKADADEMTRLQFKIYELMDEVEKEKKRAATAKATTAAARAPPRMHSAPQQVSNSPADMTSLIYPSSAGAPLSTLYSSQFAIGHRRGPEEIPGAWSCSDCTYLNYPDRTVCDMCGLNKAYEGQLGFSDVGELQSRGSSPTRGVTVPDAFGDVEVDRAY